MLLLTCFSKILDGNGVLDIGLKLFSKVILPFLGSGVTLAIQLVFELVRALNERKPTCEFWSNSGYFSSVIVVITQVGTFVPGKRSKVKWIYK